MNFLISINFFTHLSFRALILWELMVDLREICKGNKNSFNSEMCVLKKFISNHDIFKNLQIKQRI